MVLQYLVLEAIVESYSLRLASLGGLGETDGVLLQIVDGVPEEYQEGISALCTSFTLHTQLCAPFAEEGVSDNPNCGKNCQNRKYDRRDDRETTYLVLQAREYLHFERIRTYKGQLGHFQ